MTDAIKIPDDLKTMHYDCIHYPNDYQGSAPYINGMLLRLIERIARLEQERDALARQDQRLSAPVSREWMKKQQPEWGQEGRDNAVGWLNALIAARKERP